MHTGARLYKIPLLENKVTCKVMNLIKFAHRHLKSYHKSVGTLFPPKKKNTLMLEFGDPGLFIFFYLGIEYRKKGY